MKKNKEKNKGGRPATGRTIKVPAKFAGHEPRVELHPKPFRTVDEDKLPEPKDEASKHKYPPPKKHPVFREMWMKYVDSIARREHFHSGHLEILSLLCNLYVEHFELDEWIKKNGRSYVSLGRQGEVWKLYPEVGLQTKVNAQIKEYLKALGLMPKRDQGGASGTEGGEWG